MTQSQTPAVLMPVTGWGRVAATIEPHVELIIDMYVDGLSFKQIVETLNLPLTGNQVRNVLRTHHTEQFVNAVHARAEELVERSGEYASSAARAGEFKAAADISFKLAAMHDPRRFGDKRSVELTGAGGGPVKIDANVKLSPDEAYKRMLGGDE